MIDPGEMNRYIALSRWTETRSDSGFVTKTFATYYNCWAKMRTLSGRERLSAQQVNATLSHEFTIHYTSDYTIQPDHRISYSGRTFDIKDVRNVDEGDIEIRMLCSEVLTAGPSASPSPSASVSTSPSASISSSPSGSVSSSASASPSSSVSASASSSVSASPSSSGSASVSSSASSSVSASASSSVSASASEGTPSASVSASVSSSVSASVSSSASS